jgi:hypothetical protein
MTMARFLVTLRLDLRHSQTLSDTTFSHSINQVLSITQIENTEDIQWMCERLLRCHGPRYLI